MSTRKLNKKLGAINEIISKGIERNVLHLRTEDQSYDGRTVTVNGQELTNFGSCSYLGLEMDSRLKDAAIDAIQRFGVQFSSSRSYLSTSLYTEWESLLEEMFDAPIALSTSVSLGHHAVIPVVVEKGDLIIQDQQVHASVQDAVSKMHAKGVDITVVRHNRLDELEKKILANKHKYSKIWYMIDGVYSMYGDFAPMKEIIALLDKYPSLHLYADDAHGMSIVGKNGTGVILNQVNLHPKMIMATSLNKAFASGGGAFIFPNKEICQLVKNCGGSFIFSGGHQVPVIAAGIASAKIHLSDEIVQKQNALMEKLEYCHHLLNDVYNLPVVSNPKSPIIYIGLGLVRVGYNMVQRVIADGCFVNLGVFPAVPETCTGLRFTLTLHHSTEDIEKVCAVLAHHFPKALADEGRTINDVYRAFKHVPHFKQKTIEELEVPVSKSAFKTEHYRSVREIHKDDWEILFGDEISIGREGVCVLEDTFCDNENIEDNWEFHYLIVRDRKGTPIAATFYTITTLKDDMMVSASISDQVEISRMSDKYYLCSKSMIMGTLLTEGKHLYVNREMLEWREALSLLLDLTWELQDSSNSNAILLRDFGVDDREITDFLAEQGFLKTELPNSHVVENISRKPFDEYLRSVKSKRRKYLTTGALKYLDEFNADIVTEYNDKRILEWYNIYLQVKRKSTELNTFELPIKLFKNMVLSGSFEIMEITHRDRNDPDGIHQIAGVTFSHISEKNYSGILLGMDYALLKSKDVYKQILYRTYLRAYELSCTNLNLGFTASDVKCKFGAKSIPQISLYQMRDHYGLTVMNNMSQSSVNLQNKVAETIKVIN